MKAFTITLSSDNLFDTIAGKSEIFHCLGTPCLIKLVFLSFNGLQTHWTAENMQWFLIAREPSGQDWRILELKV